LRIPIHPGDAPGDAFGQIGNVIEPGHAEIDRAEGERPFRIKAERQGHRGPNCAAMGDDDDIDAFMRGGQPVYGRRDPGNQIGEVFAIRRPREGRRAPMPSADCNRSRKRTLVK